MKLSIMFITYNRKKELLRALESCVSNKMDDMEIIIVDNHSTDGSQQLIEEFLKSKNILYKYFYSDINLGISEGRNKAFELCEGDFVLCLDDDAVIASNHFFEKICNEMYKRDAIAAAVCIYEPESNKYLKGYTYKKNNESLALSYVGAAHVLKRKFFAGKVLYPSTLKFGSEELYVAYRIRKYNKKMIYIDDAVVYHLPSKVARVYGEERKINIITNTYIIRKMCYPKSILPILTIFLFIRIVKHKYYRNGYYKKISNMIRERYLDKYVDRMGYKEFLKMIADVGITQVF